MGLTRPESWRSVIVVFLATELFIAYAAPPLGKKDVASEDDRASAQSSQQVRSFRRNTTEYQLHHLGRRRPILASEWISSNFGKNPKEIGSLHSALDPLSSAAHRRGAFLDNMLQMIDQSSEKADPEPEPRSPVVSITIPTLEGEHTVHPGPDASYLIAVYYPRADFDHLWFDAPIETFFR